MTTGQTACFYGFESQEEKSFEQKVWRYPRFLRPFGCQVTWVSGVNAMTLVLKLNALIPVNVIFKSLIVLIFV